MTSGFAAIEIPTSTTIIDLAKVARLLRCRLRITDHGTVRMEPETAGAGGYQPRQAIHADGARPPEAE